MKLENLNISNLTLIAYPIATALIVLIDMGITKLVKLIVNKFKKETTDELKEEAVVSEQ